MLLSQNWVKLNYGNVIFVFVGKPQYFKSLLVEMSELLPSRFLEILLKISGNAYSTTLTRKTRKLTPEISSASSLLFFVILTMSILLRFLAGHLSKKRDPKRTGNLRY